MVDLKSCPLCGSRRVKRVRRTLLREFLGASYSVPNVEFEVCANCGESFYSPEAIDKIQSHSPAFAGRKQERTKRRAAQPASHAAH